MELRGGVLLWKQRATSIQFTLICISAILGGRAQFNLPCRRPITLLCFVYPQFALLGLLDRIRPVTTRENKMLRHVFRLAILPISFLVGTVEVQANSPRGLISGSIKEALTDSCFVDNGYVTYERDFRSSPRSGTKSVLILPEIFVGQRDSNAVWDLAGLVILKFLSRNSGSIVFKETGFEGRFSSYSERRQSSLGRLDVSFVLNLPDHNCTLPIHLELEYSTR